MKYHVLGDIGGQIKVFEESLKRMNVSDDFIIPKNETIIQIGDIFRMSDNPHLNNIECVKLADKLIRKNPHNYIQILGNHESAFINGRIPSLWRGKKALYDQESFSIINSWWKEKKVKFAHTIETLDGTILFTHAGVSYNFLESINLEKAKPFEISRHLNSLIGDRKYYEKAKVGVIAFNEKINPQADNLWAASSDEMYPSWFNQEMTFHQVHGHDIPLLSWEERSFRNDTVNKYFDFKINPDQRLMTAINKDNWKIQSCDWVLKDHPHEDSEHYGFLTYNSI